MNQVGSEPIFKKSLIHIVKAIKKQSVLFKKKQNSRRDCLVWSQVQLGKQKQ